MNNTEQETFSVFARGHLNSSGKAVLATHPNATQDIAQTGQYIGCKVSSTLLSHIFQYSHSVNRPVIKQV